MNNYMDSKMPLTRRSLMLLLVGFLLMVLGYVLLCGGGVEDPQVFNYAMFDFRRLVAAPVAIVSGMVVVIVAIMRKAKEDEK